MSAAITVDGVTKRYRIYTERNQRLKNAMLRGKRAAFTEFEALSNVSFEVPTGSTFGVVGPNGAGKSTMLKVLAKILEPDMGSVHVEGRTSALLELGAGFHPELSGRENVFLNGAILGLSKRTLESRFDSIVEFAGLEASIDNPVKTYSSGMYARLGFSVAINVEPDVLLLDEVLAVGDEMFQRRCMEKIEQLRSGGRTVVIVSHGLGQIQAMCSQAIWIEGGTVRKEGTGADVVRAYTNSVHPDVVLDETGRQHTGSGEVRITSVSFEGHGGDLSTTMPATLRIEWDASEEIINPIVGYLFYRIDGVMASGTNTREKLVIEKMPKGPGAIEYEIDRLALMPGTYELQLAIADYTASHYYDQLNRALRFDVAMPPDFGSYAGVADMGGTFRLVAPRETK
jgi:ABC-type polysaccharide/polyol phosphate transport system ATPase subunit